MYPITSWLIGIGLVLIVTTTWLNNTIFAFLNYRWMRPSTFTLTHLVVYAMILWIARASARNERAIVSAILAYGGWAFLSTLLNGGLNYYTLEQVLLIPVTMLAWAVALPKLWSVQTYRRAAALIILFFASWGLVTTYIQARQLTELMGIPLNVSVNRSGRYIFLGSLYSSKNNICSYMVFFPTFIFWASDEWRKHKILYASTLALFLAHQLLLASRSAWVATLIAMTPLGVWGFHRLGRTRALMGLAAAGILAGAVFVEFHHSIDYTGFVYVKDRTDIWGDLIAKFLKRPIMGYGLFGESLGGVLPHSIALAQLAYFGAIGLGLAFWVFLAFYRDIKVRLQPRPRNSRVVSGVFLLWGCITQGLVEWTVSHPLFLTNTLFWFTVGMIRANDA